MELVEFVRWCAKVAGSDNQDSFGRSMRDARFPYGTVSWWVHEYEEAKKKGAV